MSPLTADRSPRSPRSPVESAENIGCNDLSLRERLEKFELDDAGSRLRFSERLARENGWNMRYARRVVAEYKRFLELAVTAGHTVTPSDAVDQAWHLHMVYTRSYWGELCGQVLQQPLHHGPTKGGQVERDRFEDLYAKTLESYIQCFGEHPPTDIWPPSEERFRQSIQSIRVDRGRNWVIPKPNWMRVAGAGALASAPLIVGMSDVFAVGGLFDVNGKTFLIIYILMMVAAFLIGIVLRAGLRRDSQSGRMPPEPNQVGWAASAVLIGGFNRAVVAVIARLRSEGRVSLVNKRLVSDAEPSQELSAGLNASGLNPDHLTPTSVGPASSGFEIANTKDDIAVINAAEKLIQGEPAGIKVNKFAIALSAELNRSTILLEQLDLWLSSGERLSRGMATAGPTGLVLLVGLARCALGISRDRPIGFLVILSLITAVMGLVFLFSFPRKTRLGDQYISQLEAKFPKPAKSRKPTTTDSKEQDQAFDPVMASPFLAAVYGSMLMSEISTGEDAEFYSSLNSQVSPAPSGSLFDGVGGGDGGGAGCGGGCGGCGGCGG